jgi:hypothetical protein
VAVRFLIPPAWQLAGVPAILVAFFAVLWMTGFGPEDRELFRMGKADVKELRDAEARDLIQDDIV